MLVPSEGLAEQTVQDCPEVLLQMTMQLSAETSLPMKHKLRLTCGVSDVHASSGLADPCMGPV